MFSWKEKTGERKGALAEGHRQIPLWDGGCKTPHFFLFTRVFTSIMR